MTYLSKIAITIVLGATMALTACALPVGGNMNAQIATPTLPTDYPTELPTNYPTELPTELSTSIAATPTTTSAEPKPVEIPLTNIIFDDPETQDHIEVLSIIRNFRSPWYQQGNGIIAGQGDSRGGVHQYHFPWRL